MWTMTTCDDNIPDTELFTTESDLNTAILKHYQAIWKDAGVEDPMPDTWQGIKRELEALEVLLPSQIAHVQQHNPFGAAADSDAA